MSNYSMDNWVYDSLLIYSTMVLIIIIFATHSLADRFKRAGKFIIAYFPMIFISELGGIIARQFTLEAYGWVVGALLGAVIGYFGIGLLFGFLKKVFERQSKSTKAIIILLIIAIALFIFKYGLTLFN